MSERNGRKGPKGRKAGTAPAARVTAASVAHRVADEAEDLAALLHKGAEEANLEKLAMLVLVDCHRRLTRLAARMEGAQP
jgi:hypothetical protein